MRSAPPSVTIGVPVYNGAQYLPQCLDSLLDQDHREFVLLIADNASVDDSCEIAQRYAAMDRRIRYHRHDQNIGMYRNMDFLLRSANTPYVKLANADDYWGAGMLSDALQVLESDPDVALAYPMMTLVDESGIPGQGHAARLHLVEPDPVTRFKRVLAEIGLVSQLMGVMRTDIVKNMRALRNIPGEDVLFVAEISLYGKIFQTDSFQYFRRMHPNSSSYDRESIKHQTRHVLASGDRRPNYVAWRLNAGLLPRIASSPIQLPSRLNLYAHVGRRIIWQRHGLLDELLHRG